MPLLFADVARDYLHAAAYERGLSKTSVGTYRAWLGHYQRWADNAGLPGDALPGLDQDTKVPDFGA